MSEITNMAAEKLIRASDARRAILKAEPRLAYCIDNIPGVEAAPVVHGSFEFACVHNGKKHYKCTNCHHAFPFANVNYCPNCGAKMDGDMNE